MFEPQNDSSSEEEVDFSMAQGQQETEETVTIPSIAPWPITNSASAAIARLCLQKMKAFACRRWPFWATDFKKSTIQITERAGIINSHNMLARRAGALLLVLG